MFSIEGRNINDIVGKALPSLVVHGIREKSRNGDVIVFPTPVCTTYKNPTERVLFGETRDANPFFHLMEALWMLAGRNDLEFPMYFNSRFGEYSDDGKTVWGAYGWRWRKFFGMDQLHEIITELKKNPHSRRCVLSMWNGMTCHEDDDMWVAANGGKDVPCNTHAYFDLRNGNLNMTVCNRSNDVIWGAYGANIVHFSILLEYLASALKVPVGMYRQMSNNFHAYTDIYAPEKLAKIAEEARKQNHYTNLAGEGDSVSPYPLMSTSVESWDEDLNKFIEDPTRFNIYEDKFFDDVAHPVYMAYLSRKEKVSSGMEYVEKIKATDWQLACRQWIERREAK